VAVASFSSSQLPCLGILCIGIGFYETTSIRSLYEIAVCSVPPF
jgi:hypothetical protein